MSTHSLSLPRRLSLAALVLAAFAAPASAVTLQPQEQVIASYMMNSPGQGRAQLILDPVIEAVARARAQDMAVRGYFGHVNPDGHASNYLLAQAGYQLPPSWYADPAANYVESIAAGYSSATETWNAWMNDPAHRTHLLANAGGDSSEAQAATFFATETHYGVGYYADPNSQYGYYWVVITAPPQPVTIDAPSQNETVLTGSAAIAGTAASGAAAVRYEVVNSSGTSGWQTATGVSNWSAEVSLMAGANVVHAQSLDSSGNEIAQASRTITYVPQSQLTVSVSGSGAVTTGFLGTTGHNLGASITLHATPAAGFVFAGWSGSVSGSAATLTFPLTQNAMSEEANFIPNPLGPVLGSYAGLLTSGSNGPEGFFRATVSASGAMSGRVTLGRSSYAFTGSMNGSGVAEITIQRLGAGPLSLTLQGDLSGGSQQLDGTLTDGTNSESISADHATFNAKTNAAPQAGRYTMVISPAANGDPSQTPQGNGYAVIAVNANGVATIIGRLGDGTLFSNSTVVTENGTLPIFFVPGGEANGSSVSGLLTFQDTSVSDLDGMLSWTKAPHATDTFYPAGFATALPSVGSRYVAPQTGGLRPLILGASSAIIGLGGGNIPQPVDVPVNIGANNLGTMSTPGAPHLSFRISPASGGVAGSFVLPDGNVARGFVGVILQKQNAAYGYFRGVNETGYFALSPAS